MKLPGECLLHLQSREESVRATSRRSLMGIILSPARSPAVLTRLMRGFLLSVRRPTPAHLVSFPVASYDYDRKTVWSPRSLLFFAILLTTNLRTHSQDLQGANAGSPSVADDTRLLESTRPQSAIVRDVTQISPEEGGVLQQWLNGDAATGNWLGARSAFLNSGVTFFGSYESNSAANVSGGRSAGAAYADNFDFGVRLDLEKSVGWKGGTFTLDFSHRNGTSITDRHVGNFFQVQQLFGVGTFMLYGIYLEQKLMDDRFSLKIGRFATNEDFAVSPIYGLYMGNGIDGNPKTLISSGAFSSYPGSVWAARIRLEPTKETNFSVGVYQTNDRLYDPNQHGFDWTIRSEDGVLLIAQLGWTPEFFKKPVVVQRASGKAVSDGKQMAAPNESVEMKGLPGHYWVGSYVTFGDYTQFGTIEKGNGPYAYYVHADQMVYQEQPGSDQGLTLWADVVAQPDHAVNIIPFQVNAGVVYKGLIPRRDQDVTIFGVVYGEFSDDYARVVSPTGIDRPTYETVLEVGYRVQLTKFAYVMPELQYIINPGGTGQLDDAAVLGLRVGITF